MSVDVESPFERKDVRDDRAHQPGVDQPADLTKLLAIDLDDEPDGSPTIVGIALRRTRHDDGHEAAAGTQDLPRALPRSAADRVEH